MTEVAQLPQVSVDLPLESEVHNRSLAELDQALICLAYCNGSTPKAEAMLREAGMKIGSSTLHEWKTRYHVQRYEQIRASVAKQVMAKAAEEHSSLAAQQMEVSRAMTERIAQSIEEIPARELSGAIRNMSVGSKVHEDAASELRGEPGREEMKRGASEVLRALASKLGLDPAQLTQGSAESD